MPEEARQRVDRLVRWVKAHRRDLLGPDLEVVPTKLAKALDEQSVPYWSDVLRYKKASFAAAKAREVESLLRMRPFYLDGAGWPFEGVDEAAFDRLTERQKGRVEQALIDAMAAIAGESKVSNGV